MAIEEFQTDGGYVIFTNTPKKVKDSYTMRKFQRDRLRLQQMLTKLLDIHDVIIFYKDEDDVIQNTVGTRNSHRRELSDYPITMEEYKKGPVEEIQHISFLAIPGYEPTILHVDSITKFIVSATDIYELLNVIGKDVEEVS